MMTFISTTECKDIDWLKEHKYTLGEGEDFSRKGYKIDVESLEELLLIADKTECSLIITREDHYKEVEMSVEVYDGYRE